MFTTGSSIGVFITLVVIVVAAAPIIGIVFFVTSVNFNAFKSTLFYKIKKREGDLRYKKNMVSSWNLTKAS